MKCNRNKLAELFGYDVKTIDKMVKKGMPFVSKPTHGPGRTGWVFDTVEVFQWLSGDENDRKLKDAELRMARAKAGLRALEYEEARGAMTEWRNIIPPLEEALGVAKSRLLALPGRLTHIVTAQSDPAAIEKILKDEIDDIEKGLNPLLILADLLEEARRKGQLSR